MKDISKNLINSYVINKENEKNVLDDLEKIRKRKEKEKPLKDKIIDDIITYLAEQVVGESLVGYFERMGILGKCFVSGIEYICTDSIDGFLKLFKIKNKFADQINNKKEDIQESFTSEFVGLKINMKSFVNGGIMPEKLNQFDIPVGKLIMYGIPFLASGIIIKLEEKAAKKKNDIRGLKYYPKHDIKNLGDYFAYEKLIQISIVDEIRENLFETYLHSITKCVQDKLMPFNKEAYDLSKYVVEENKAADRIICSVEIIENAIKELELYKSIQKEHLSKLLNAYNEFRYDCYSEESLIYFAEEKLKNIHKKIKYTVDESEKASNILKMKISILEEYSK